LAAARLRTRGRIVYTFLLVMLLVGLLPLAVVARQLITISREALVRRLLTLGRTSADFYERKRRQYRREYEEAQAEQTGGFVSPATNAISTSGKAFVRTILDAYHQRKITASDLADYLEVRLKHLPKIEAAVR